MSSAIKYVFRMTHIHNMPHILQEGFVHSDSPRASKDYIPIGDRTLIETRGKKLIMNRPINGYIPFYFGFRSPMLYVIQNGFNGVTKREPQEIIYCVLRLDDIIASGLRFVFTDGHANDSLTNVFEADRINDLDVIVRAEDVYAQFWSSDEDTDLKRRKDAEFLFLDEVPASLISGYVVYNQDAKQNLMAMGISPEKVVVKPEYYY